MPQNDTGYPSPFGVTVDPVVFTVVDGALAVLLARRESEPWAGEMALPGGFLGETESPEQTVARKLTEKTGMPPLYLEQLRTYADPGRDPRGWVLTIAYLALVPAVSTLNADSAWVPQRQLTVGLPFDHDRLIADGAARLAGKLWYSDVARGVLADAFTMREALDAFNAIAGRDHGRLDNFTRDLLRTGLIEPTGEVGTAASGGGPRPKLYRFAVR